MLSELGAFRVRECAYTFFLDQFVDPFPLPISSELIQTLFELSARIEVLVVGNFDCSQLAQMSAKSRHSNSRI